MRYWQVCFSFLVLFRSIWLEQHGMKLSLCKTYCATCIGLEVVTVTVEVSITAGVGLYIIGLPDSAVREALMRVSTALQRNGYQVSGRMTVINLAPADLRKEGSGYDAAIAIAILGASGQIDIPYPDEYLIVGELSLDGELRKVPGMLAIAIKAAQSRFRYIICPIENAAEASWADDITVYGVKGLQQILSILSGSSEAERYIVTRDIRPLEVKYPFDFKDIVGQKSARRGAEIAASGGHNMLMCGPPGSGKSLISKCMASILPPMSKKESLQTSMIHSVAGILDAENGLVTHRPFRSPHHTSSAVALVGGGSHAMPGEISLAHNGVLCLDEISLFPAATLEMLRQPMEDRMITISRARYKVRFPASFMLIASMNPCPCGHYGEGSGICTCTPAMIARYKARLSGPMLDRMDLKINVKAMDTSAFVTDAEAESSAVIAARVAAARQIQAERFKDEGIFTNAQMSAAMINRYCTMDKEESDFLQKVSSAYRLSARGYVRILKVSRTIADMEGSERIRIPHISEASHYRFREDI